MSLKVILCIVCGVGVSNSEPQEFLFNNAQSSPFANPATNFNPADPRLNGFTPQPSQNNLFGANAQLQNFQRQSNLVGDNAQLQNFQRQSNLFGANGQLQNVALQSSPFGVDGQLQNFQRQSNLFGANGQLQNLPQGNTLGLNGQIQNLQPQNNLLGATGQLQNFNNRFSANQNLLNNDFNSIRSGQAGINPLLNQGNFAQNQINAPFGGFSGGQSVFNQLPASQSQFNLPGQNFNQQLSIRQNPLASPLSSLSGQGGISNFNNIQTSTGLSRLFKGLGDATSPSAAAALAYLNQVSSTDVCANLAVTYLQTILSGGSEEQAIAGTTELYRKSFGQSMLVKPGTACEAAETAWKQAISTGQDPVSSASVAFMSKWQGTIDGNPCSLAGSAYINGIISGSTHLQAAAAASTAFSIAFQNFATKGRELKDPACAAAAKAYISALPASDLPSPTAAAAMIAFIEKAFSGPKLQFDPVCLKASETFFKSFSTSNNEFTATVDAAQAFIDEFAKGTSGVPVESPCSAAAFAYWNASPIIASPANKAAMKAFMDKMLAGGIREPDAVCAAAAKSFLTSFKNGADETSAGLAAAEAFIQAYSAGSFIPVDSPCSAAAKAYFASQPIRPSSPSAEAMLTYIDTLIAQGNKRILDPLCSTATNAFFQAYKTGADELTAAFSAAKAFITQYKAGVKGVVDSPCLRAAKVYAGNIRGKPSTGNNAAMLAFMDAAVLSGTQTVDPVCLSAADAYFTAFLAGKPEIKAMEAASVAFIDAVAANPTFYPNSPCGLAAKAYIKSSGFRADPLLEGLFEG